MHTAAVSLYETEKEKTQRHTEGKGHVKTEAEIGDASTKQGVPKIVCSQQKLEEARNELATRAFKRSIVLPTS